MLRDKPTTLWTQRGENGNVIECVMRFVPNSVEIEIISNGAPLCSRIFPTGHEALAWSEEERKEWNAGRRPLAATTLT